MTRYWYVLPWTWDILGKDFSFFWLSGHSCGAAALITASLSPRLHSEDNFHLIGNGKPNRMELEQVFFIFARNIGSTQHGYCCRCINFIVLVLFPKSVSFGFCSPVSGENPDGNFLFGKYFSCVVNLISFPTSFRQCWRNKKQTISVQHSRFLLQMICFGIWVLYLPFTYNVEWNKFYAFRKDNKYFVTQCE